MNFLEFEKPIADLFTQLTEAQELAAKSGVDMKKAIAELEQKIEDTRKSIYQKLSPWQRVQVSRQPANPYSLSDIQYNTERVFFLKRWAS